MGSRHVWEEGRSPAGRGWWQARGQGFTNLSHVCKSVCPQAGGGEGVGRSTKGIMQVVVVQVWCVR